MPAVFLFGKRTLLGGDDLQLPAMITMCVRTMQLALFVTPMTYWLWLQAFTTTTTTSDEEGRGESILDHLLVDYSDSAACRHSHFFPLQTSMYLMSTTIFALASLILEYHIFYWTCQGRPTQSQPRTSKIETLLELKLFVLTIFLTLIVMTYASAQVFAKTYRSCLQEQQQVQQLEDDDDYDTHDDDDYSFKIVVGSHKWWALSTLLVASQVAEVFLTVLFWIRLCRAPVSYPQQQQHSHPYYVTHNNSNLEPSSSILTNSEHHELTEELWQDRCHNLCQCLSFTTCCLFGGHDLYRNNNTNNYGNYYQHVAKALADFLETGGTLDVVPTDILAGLMVLQRLQRQRVLQARLQVRRSSHRQLLPLANASASAATSTRRLSSSSSTSPSPPATTAIQETTTLLLPGQSNNAIVDISRPKTPDKTTKLRSRSTSSNDLLSAPLSTSNSVVAARSSLTPNSSDLAEMATTTANKTTTAPPRTSFFSMNIASSSSSDNKDNPNNNSLSRRIFRRTMFRQNNNPTAPATTIPSSQTDISNSTYYQAENRKVLNPLNPIDCQRLQEGAQMAKYALCIYTWMLYVYVHPLKGMAKLLYRSMNDPCRSTSSQRPLHESALLGSATNNPYYSPSSTTTKGDNWFEWHKHALLLVAGLEESDLVYAQFENRVSLMPYCILLDHGQKCIVVSIRGSLSLEDLVTDVHVDPEPVEALGIRYGFDATNQYCHAGVVKCAQNIHDDIQRRLVDVATAYPQYELRLCGHSLGAGICTLLGYMLRRSSLPQFQRLRVFNYSPPGCTMTWELATKCEPWTTTFVLDSDIVPRLSVMALEDLRDEVLQLVGRLKVPKYHVVQSFMNPNKLLRKWCGNNRQREGYEQEDLQDLNRIIDEWLDDEDDMATNSPRRPSNTYTRQVAEFLQVQEQRKQARGESRRLKLYPPGRMIHLVKTGEMGGWNNTVKKCITCGTSNSGFLYTPVYVANDDLDEIVVTPTMGTDHFVDRMVDELTNLAQDYYGGGGGTSASPATGNNSPSSSPDFNQDPAGVMV